jgi:hypothetical protein
MRQSTAIEQLREMMRLIQKARSNAKEGSAAWLMVDAVDESVLAMVEPWLFGDKCPLPMLHKMLDDIDGGRELQPSEHYNMMTILYRFLGKWVDAAVAVGATTLPHEQPDPLTYLTGWEAE